jgi:hypothetical protein
MKYDFVENVNDYKKWQDCQAKMKTDPEIILI